MLNYMYFMYNINENMKSHLDRLHLSKITANSLKTDSSWHTPSLWHKGISESLLLTRGDKLVAVPPGSSCSHVAISDEVESPLLARVVDTLCNINWILPSSSSWPVAIHLLASNIWLDALTKSALNWLPLCAKTLSWQASFLCSYTVNWTPSFVILKSWHRDCSSF